MSSATARGQLTPRVAYRPGELAEALGCTRQHVYDLIADGTIPSFKLGRSRYIPTAVVEQIITDTLEQSGGDAA